ncbi:MAG: DnaD domain protein [Dehalococcoidales bacterium]
MKKFAGFPGRMQFTPLPNVFFSTLIPQITDAAELKVTLYIFFALYRKKGYPRCVSYRQLEGIPALMHSLGDTAHSPSEILRGALAMAVERGSILHMAMERNGVAEDIYFVNAEPDRRVVERIKSGEISLQDLVVGPETDNAVSVADRPDIFTVYEENVGMLTPIIAEELMQAERIYPEGWIADAIKEAVLLNKRNWRYISRILERWKQEGRSDGTPGRYSKREDTERYTKQKYGHMFQR